ncbi:MAG TPA: calcium-binding protein [Caulobacteraceae bacterium]
MPVQNSDIIETGAGDGITFTSASQTWTVTEGVTVAANTGNAAVSTFDDAALANYGTLVSDEGAAVRFDGESCLLMNDDGGNVMGETGVLVNAYGGDIVNDGSISGHTFGGVHFSATSEFGSVTNSGSIMGWFQGIYIESETGKTSISNSGEITGHNQGIAQIGDAPTVVFNSGLIASTAVGIGGASIYAQAGRMTVFNEGTLSGDVRLADRGDRIVNNGEIYGEVDLGAGNDRFSGPRGLVDGVVSGGAGADTLLGGVNADRFSGGADADLLDGLAGEDVLTGGGGGDVVRGGAGADTLLGGAGDDRVRGEAGDDLLRGGAGQDVFVFDRRGGSDTVDGFGGQDQLDFSEFGYTAEQIIDLAEQIGGDVLITLDTDESVRLTDFQVERLDTSDFIVTG